MASNILKPIGFILILGAVAAGAYYLGQSSSGKSATTGAKTGQGGRTASAQPAGSAPSGGSPGVVQQVKDWVGGTPAPESAPASGAEAVPNDNPRPPVPPVKPAVRPPAKPASPSAPAALPAVADAVPTTVTALSGDTVLTKAKAKVRLLGIKTPESGTDSAHARDALAQLLGDGAVKVQLTGDHTAALVWKDNRLVNESMVRLGWSRSLVANFMTAEAEAKRNRDGLWSPEGWMGP